MSQTVIMVRLITPILPLTVFMIYIYKTSFISDESLVITKIVNYKKFAYNMSILYTVPILTKNWMK